MRESVTRPEHHLSDPGKEARARSGIPIVPAFDGYRAWAIMAIVMLHMTAISGVAGPGVENAFTRLIWGALGNAVELLFIVSGFVVFLPTVARRGDFGSIASFAIRRGARLLPAYWMILLISLPVIAVFDPPYSALPGLRDLLLNFSALTVPVGLFVPGISIGFGLDPPLWTLSVEVGFYLVLPFVASIFFRKPVAGLLVSLAVTAAWTIAFDHVSEVTDLIATAPDFGELVRLKLSSELQLPAWAYSFGLGMFGAWVWVRISERQGRGEAEAPVPRSGPAPAALIALVSGLALIPLVWVIGGDYSNTRASLLLSLLFSTLVAIFMVSLSLAPRSWQTPFAAQPVRNLGDISYGIYLSHMVITYTIAGELTLPQDGNLKSLLIWTAVVVPLSVIYGYLSARFLEQPIRRWARKYGRRVPE
ncbi:MAG TPA: acyltransferase [Solirubrobacterales bacterium]|nr:acyltransferase [Solirubrobacterales bacterium]